MSYSIKISGAAKTARMFQAPSGEGRPHDACRAAEAINRRHAAVFRRTWIPIDTGACKPPLDIHMGQTDSSSFNASASPSTQSCPTAPLHWHRFTPPLKLW